MPHLPYRIHGEWQFKEVIVASEQGGMQALLREVGCSHNLYTDDLSLHLFCYHCGAGGGSRKIRNNNNNIF